MQAFNIQSSVRPRPVVNWFAASLIVLGHVAVILLLTQLRGGSETESVFREAPMEASLLDAPQLIEELPAPVRPQPVPIEIQLSAPPSFEVQDSTNGTSLPTSTRLKPPVLKASNDDAFETFRRRAALADGQISRTIVAVEVMADGSTGDVSIASSSGIPRADAAALAYAQSCAWIPARNGGAAIPFKIALPVVFNGRG